MHYIIRVYYTVDTTKGWDSSDYAVYTDEREFFYRDAIARQKFVNHGGKSESIIGTECIKTCRY